MASVYWNGPRKGGQSLVGSKSDVLLDGRATVFARRADGEDPFRPGLRSPPGSLLDPNVPRTFK